MAKSKKKQQKDKAKALGCATGVVILLGFSACDAIFGDDEPEPLTVAPLRTTATASSAPPTTDADSLTACSRTAQAAALRKAGQKKRAINLESAALAAATTSAAPDLARLGPTRTRANIKLLRGWCATHHPGIKAGPVEPEPQKTRKPRPQKTTSKPAAPSTDPRFPTCSAANDAGYGPYREGVNPEYAWYQDRDGDGVVCES
ncbi:excalibur calcium-binding domain-containing protein [Actinocorallia populi]|uniref:excalibur calcium-binding domain-containing protein n=1 Tax=Actinocorallia populi TaxID=2079200 RepID=UPI0018E54589|nr:excalibur calcium-binding domain-containing protein [Actinocorallia populi]